MKARLSAIVQSLASGKVRVGGAGKSLTRAKAFIGGSLKEVASFIAPLSASTNSTLGKIVRGGGYSTTTTYATATVTGGRAPFTYSWARLSGSTAVAEAPSSAATQFSDYVDVGNTSTSTWRCTVTSFDGQVAQTNIVTVTFTGLDDSGIS